MRKISHLSNNKERVFPNLTKSDRFSLIRGYGGNLRNERASIRFEEVPPEKIEKYQTIKFRKKQKTLKMPGVIIFPCYCLVAMFCLYLLAGLCFLGIRIIPMVYGYLWYYGIAQTETHFIVFIVFSSISLLLDLIFILHYTGGWQSFR